MTVDNSRRRFAVCHEKWFGKHEDDAEVKDEEPRWQFLSDEKEAEPAPVEEPERELVHT